MRTDWFNPSLTLPVIDSVRVSLPTLLIILFAPILLNKLRTPHIIGMILVSLVIGEHGLNILVRDSSFEPFGKVGLYHIMFLAGLEVNMGDFKENRGKAVMLGLLAFIIPTGIGLATNMMPLKYGPVMSVLLASMYTSHTSVAYPTTIRCGVPHHHSVSTAVEETVVTDTLTLLVLAVVGGLFKGRSGGLFWLWLVIKVVLLGALIMYLFPRIGRWFFRRCDDNVIQFIFVPATVFLDTGLMEFVGMEGILGVFLVGLALNRLMPHVSPLVNHLEFVNNVLSTPYFLIGVGMLIGIHVIFGQGGALKVTTIMIAVALMGRWTASQLTQKIYKMAPIERELMFGLGNAQAVAMLAAVLVGYNTISPDNERSLNEGILNGTVLLILVTRAVSSFITERAACKIATCEAHLEEERMVEAEKILTPIANPDATKYLVNLSLLIRDTEQKDNLLVLNVISDNNTFEDLELRSKKYLEKTAMIIAPTDVPLRQITRHDLNTVSGITHTTKEYEVIDVTIDLHRKASIVNSFSGMFAESLLEGLCREMMIARFLTPINAVRRIIIAVPPKVGYEAGSQKQVEHFYRTGGTLGCRIHFFANEEVVARLQVLVKKEYGQTLTDFSRLDDRGDLLTLAGQVSYDRLLVVIGVCRGPISYGSSFEKLPAQLGKYLSNNSLIVFYPDQLGEPQDIVSFSNPCNEAQHYEKVGKWVCKWLKES